MVSLPHRGAAVRLSRRLRMLGTCEASRVSAAPPFAGPGLRRAWVLMAVALTGISVSAPLSAVTAAPALAIAFWRNVTGAAVSAGYLAIRRGRRPGRAAPQRLLPGVLPLAAVSGLLLAVHFGSWLSGLRLTSVTASTALVSTTPVWTVALDLLRRVPVPRRVLLGLIPALAGVVAITGVDAARSPQALAGDLLSLLGAVAAAGYVAIGARLVPRTGPALYTVLVYGGCAIALLPVCLLSGIRLTGYSGRTWLDLALITLTAQLLGHTLINTALPRIGVTPVALAILLEVPGAALVGWAVFGQVPPVTVVPGTALMLLGLALVVSASRPPGPPGSPDPGPGVADVTTR
jgi:drug/metabolite transporter (DMT)-like permease